MIKKIRNRKVAWNNGTTNSTIENLPIQYTTLKVVIVQHQKTLFNQIRMFSFDRIEHLIKKCLVRRITRPIESTTPKQVITMIKKFRNRKAVWNEMITNSAIPNLPIKYTTHFLNVTNVIFYFRYLPTS